MPNGSFRSPGRKSDNLIKEKQPHNKPETGILTILYFILQGYKKIHLYNFDFGETYHYYGDEYRDKPNPSHDWSYSKKIVEHFIKKGRLEILE